MKYINSQIQDAQLQVQYIQKNQKQDKNQLDMSK